MLKYILLILIFSFSSLQNTKATAFHGYVGYKEIPKPSFTKAHFDQILENKKPQSISELLTLLPAQIKKNVIVIFKSRSLQEATGKNPRVLLFNEDASLIVTFNGHPSQAGYEALEMVFFDFQKLKFNFQEIIFNDDLKQRLKFESQAGDRTHRSGINPPACLACHRTPEPRPNWGVYPFWPGIIGQTDTGLDRLVGEFNTNNYVLNAEWQAFQEFLINAKNNQRFRHLGIDFNFWLKKLAEVESRNNLIQNSIYVSSDKNNFLHKASELTASLAALNFLRLGADIVCHKSYTLNKKIILQALQNNSPYPADFQAMSRILNINLEDFNKQVEAIHRTQAESDTLFKKQISEHSRGRVGFAENLGFGVHTNTAFLSIALKEKFNIDLSNYELSFERGTYNFSTPNNWIDNLKETILHVENNFTCP